MKQYTVSLDWLSEHLEGVKVVDCRFSLQDSADGLRRYQDGHIQGAVYFDLVHDLSGTVQDHGGRHPLPEVDTFLEKVEAAGIDHETTVVAYDDEGGPFASRFWWLLRYLGHENVYVLDGSFSEWQAVGYPVDRNIPMYAKTTMDVKVKPERLATYTYVKQNLSDPAVHLIDAREPARFLGKVEPIDKKKGHIPNAKNRFWQDGLNGKKRKSAKEQAERFADLPKEDEVIVYCGSGVTACPNVLTLEELGYKRVRLYVGSWSDWISHDESEIATGEEGERTRDK
ncbi:sulfurtransferase [Halalkalibacterium halodurans]|uniref:Thiosulfate sulfurtransferase n=2 Tax=Halalkalibacterium halodurans TaxID=86665 RepID=Q9KC66_HALH5|nr:sulfurtransferase [Halalkalibacterium halodurans]MDY7222277.1 sulfurtransferase [Halalkalibacterium halodurans]MDY7241498.1 sulfurtransferase [Halalkalibacterium halodurans]MED3646040.1 sulfurtransferase [Halalkalibacterium halodurans]MED4082418.1 sulfurtransferase [Halalkalibacterium halodurans]MED4083431.1 sulfurtransferase [Halalkalibacterium halodurans]